MVSRCSCCLSMSEDRRQFSKVISKVSRLLLFMDLGSLMTSATNGFTAKNVSQRCPLGGQRLRRGSSVVQRRNNSHSRLARGAAADEPCDNETKSETSGVSPPGDTRCFDAAHRK